MRFIETRHFTKEVLRLLSEDEYYRFQDYLLERPDAGVVISGGSGIRKIRYAAKGHGKRGGVRIFYYWAVSRDTILLLDIFPKNERADLTNVELGALRRIVSQIFDE